MADYVTTKEVVAYGLLGVGAVTCGLGFWVGVILSGMKQRLKNTEKVLREMASSQKSNGGIQKALDQAITLLRSGGNTTTVTNDATGGAANGD